MAKRERGVGDETVLSRWAAALRKETFTANCLPAREIANSALTAYSQQWRDLLMGADWFGLEEVTEMPSKIFCRGGAFILSEIDQWRDNKGRLVGLAGVYFGSSGARLQAKLVSPPADLYDNQAPFPLCQRYIDGHNLLLSVENQWRRMAMDFCHWFDFAADPFKAKGEMVLSVQEKRRVLMEGGEVGAVSGPRGAGDWLFSFQAEGVDLLAMINLPDKQITFVVDSGERLLSDFLPKVREVLPLVLPVSGDYGVFCDHNGGLWPEEFCL